MERDNDGATPAHFAAARGKYFAHARYSFSLWFYLQNCEAKFNSESLLLRLASTLRIQGADVESMKVTTGTFSHAE